MGGYFVFSSSSADLGKTLSSGLRLPAGLLLNNYGQGSLQQWEGEGTGTKFKIRCHGNKGYITVRPDGRVSVESSHDSKISKLQWFFLEPVQTIFANFKMLPRLPNNEIALQVGVQKKIGVRNPTVFVLSNNHTSYKYFFAVFKYPRRTRSGWEKMGHGLSHIGVRPDGQLAGIRGGIIYVNSRYALDHRYLPYGTKWWAYGQYGSKKQMERVAIGGDEKWNVYLNTTVVFRDTPKSPHFTKVKDLIQPDSEAKFLTYGTDGNLFIATNTGRFTQEGRIRKQHMKSGGPVRIAAGNEKHVYGTLNNGDLVWWNSTRQKFEYQGITLQVPVIKRRPTVESNYQSFDVSAYGKLWIISGGRVYEQIGTTSLQRKLQETLQNATKLQTIKTN